MSNENILAYAVKQKEIDYNAKDLVLLQAQLINKNENGKSKNANNENATTYKIQKW